MAYFPIVKQARVITRTHPSSQSRHAMRTLGGTFIDRGKQGGHECERSENNSVEPLVNEVEELLAR